MLSYISHHTTRPTNVLASHTITTFADVRQTSRIFCDSRPSLFIDLNLKSRKVFFWFGVLAYSRPGILKTPHKHKFIHRIYASRIYTHRMHTLYSCVCVVCRRATTTSGKKTSKSATWIYNYFPMRRPLAPASSGHDHMFYKSSIAFVNVRSIRSVRA